MRHFRDINHMVEAMAEHARQQGCEIQQRDDRTFAVVKLDCDCGACSVTEIDLTATAREVWEALSWELRYFDAPASDLTGKDV